MKLIKVQNNIIINPETIISVEAEKNVVTVNLQGGYSYQVTVNINEFLALLNKSGIDLTKQFLSV